MSFRKIRSDVESFYHVIEATLYLNSLNNNFSLYYSSGKKVLINSK